MSDEEQIRQVLALYCHLFDDGEFDAWGKLWAEDGIMVNRARTCTGPADIAAFGKETGGRAREGGNQFKHITVNEIITVHGDTADVVSDGLFFTQSGDVPFRPRSAARYHDRMVKHDGRWLFAERRFASSIVTPGQPG